VLQKRRISPLARLDRAETKPGICLSAGQVLARAFEEGLGGYDGLIKWAKRSPENFTAFYTKMWIRLLPMNIKVESITYKSYQDPNT
jgi:hypothetical protein